VTEIPEHLLKRSKERRAAMGLPGGEAGASAEGGAPEAPAGDAGTSVEPAAPAAAARSAAPVAAAPPPPPPPLPPYVQAAQRRRRIPFWAMPVVALLPVWAFLYLGAVQVPPKNDDALALGEEVYAKCSSCHGGTGGGGVGAQLNQGHVLQTFKNPKDMMMWIHLGADGGARPDGTYGDADRKGGAEKVSTLPGKMPAFADLSPEELAAVTRYVRETLSGGEPAAEDVDLEAVAEDAIADAEDGKLPSAEGGTSSGKGGANASAGDKQANEGAGSDAGGSDSGSTGGDADSSGVDTPSGSGSGSDSGSGG